MGSARRFVYIITPYVLTIASLLCLIMVGLGCTMSSSDTLNNLYFIRYELRNITSTGSKTKTDIENTLNQYGITSVSPQDISDVLSKLQADSTLSDFYQIGLWGYCDGDVKNDKATVQKCSKPRNEFYFDPLSVWNLKSTGSQNELSSEFSHDLSVYKTVSKWMFVAYILAFIVTVAQLFVWFLASYSRKGGYVAGLFALLACLLTTAASVTSTALISLFESSRTTLKAYGIFLSVGKNMYTATWLAVVFSLVALIFWSITMCCCSSRLPYNHHNNNIRGTTDENTYEPLVAGQHTAAHGGDYPMTHTSKRYNA